MLSNGVEEGYLNAHNNRILYVEDHVDSRTLMSMILKRAGYQVTAVETITEAQNLTQQGSFDLYLLDSKVADGSGVMLCQQLRQFDPDVPILFYSGAAFEADKEAALSAGANAYLTKPMEMMDLTTTIAHFLKTP
ncbi:MAG: response regulator [Abitibacteriaceae bacterium]|nr:response regulator [Abditibacteriaceae bacterium]